MAKNKGTGVCVCVCVCLKLRRVIERIKGFTAAIKVALAVNYQ